MGIRHFFKGRSWLTREYTITNFKSLLSRTTEPMSTYFGTNHPCLKDYRACSNEGPALFQNEIIKKLQNILTNLKILFQNHWNIFKQTGQKTSFGEVDSTFLNEDFPRLCPRGYNYEIVQIHWQIWKNRFLQNQWANFNQTWPKISLGEGNSNLFKWRAPSLSRGRW